MTISSMIILAASDNGGNIQLYHNGFSICLAFSILFFIISIVLFFAFDIKGIFDMKTGRAEKQKIREMEEENALTGRLINPNLKHGKAKQPTEFSEKLNRLKNGSPAGNMQMPPGMIPQQHYDGQQEFQQQAYAPQPLVAPPSQGQPVNSTPAPVPEPAAQPYSDSNQTTVLTEEPVPASEQTTVLSEETAPASDQTTLLSEETAPASDQTTLLSEATAPASEQTTLLSEETAPASDQTTLLSEATAPASEQTTLLSEAAAPASEQTTLLSQEPAPQPVEQNYVEEVAQTSLLSEMKTSVSSAAPKNLPQPVHNIAGKNELGTAKGSIEFMVGDGETSRLDDTNTNSRQKYNGKFNIVKDIMLVHSTEAIN